MRFLKRKTREVRAAPEIRNDISAEDVLLRRALGGSGVTADNACEIPAFSACVGILAGAVAQLPVKLYRLKRGAVEEVKEDARLTALNDKTGDLLSPYQLREAMVRDYLECGQGYAFIEREYNRVTGLYHVRRKAVSVTESTDPIYKAATVEVNGRTYRDFEFLKIARKSINGMTGRGVPEESGEVLATVYAAMQYEKNLVLSGGNKRGYLKSENRLDDDTVTKLKKAWRKFYGNNEENIIVLNKGLDFKEASNTVVEMQLRENKVTNAELICSLFGIPPKILTGGATDDDRQLMIDNAIMPIVENINDALCRDLLLESERADFYFALDTKNLFVGDMEKRFRAYETALRANFMQLDEVRYALDLPKTGFNYLKLGLQDVLLDPHTGQVYTPNMNATATIGKAKPEGGGMIEN